MVHVHRMLPVGGSLGNLPRAQRKKAEPLFSFSPYVASVYIFQRNIITQTRVAKGDEPWRQMSRPSVPCIKCSNIKHNFSAMTEKWISVVRKKKCIDELNSIVQRKIPPEKEGHCFAGWCGRQNRSLLYRQQTQREVTPQAKRTEEHIKCTCFIVLSHFVFYPFVPGNSPNSFETGYFFAIHFLALHPDWNDVCSAL